MALSTTTAFVSDPPVTVLCLVGYVLDTNQTNKLIQCELVSGSAVWNDTVGTCYRKYTSECDHVLVLYISKKYKTSYITFMQLYLGILLTLMLLFS